MENIKEEIKKEIEEETAYGFEGTPSRMEPDSVPLAQQITENGQNVKEETDDVAISTSDHSDPDSLQTLKKEVADDTTEGDATTEQPRLSRVDAKRVYNRKIKKLRRVRRAIEKAEQLNRASVDVQPPQAQPPDHQVPRADEPPAKRICRPQNHEHNSRFRENRQLYREEALRANWQPPVNQNWGFPGHWNGGNWSHRGSANRPFLYPSENGVEGRRGQAHWQQDGPPDWPMRRSGDGGTPRDFVGDRGHHREPALFPHHSTHHEAGFAAAPPGGDGFGPGYHRVIGNENYQFPQFYQSPHYQQSAHYPQPPHHHQAPQYHRCNNCTCCHDRNCHHHGCRM